MEDALQPPQLEGAIDVGVSSCFREVETLQHMHILPSYIGRVSDGILSVLNAQILRYSKSYGGVVLAYSKPTVLGTQGLIMDEQPHIHFSVRVSLYLFKPRVNAILCGTVNSISTAHVGCLVHNCFNASVLAPVRNHDIKSTNGLFSKQLHVGSHIWFRVTRLDTTDVLFIQGEYVGMVGEANDVARADTDRPLSSIVEVTGKNVVAEKGKKKKKANEQAVTQFEEAKSVVHTEEACAKEVVDSDLIPDGKGRTESEPKKFMKKKKSLDSGEDVKCVELPAQLHGEGGGGSTRKRKRKGDGGIPAKKRKLPS